MANINQDDVLLQIFIEEATDLLGAISTTLDAWQNDLNDLSKIDDLKRDLHTLKGSARMVGQTAIGSLSHAIETLCVALYQQVIPIERSIFTLILSAQDRIASIIEALKNKTEPENIEDLIEAIHQYLPQSKGESIPSETHQAITSTTVSSTVQTDDYPKTETNGTHEIVRIRADLLEKINNLSTENNLIRISLEQKIARVSTYLQEMKQSTRHLEEKIIILNDEIQNNEFIDPNACPILNELCHSIHESNIDILSVLKTLVEENTSMETLYLHQARVSTELQHRLSHTRLVSFDSIVPRLSRVARQIAQELKKEIDFKVLKTQGEMDRTVLEHLIPSLEHILRNALDHGIESPEIRKQKGKPEVGKIEVSFIQSGSTVSITVADDGCGINSDIIRQKAISLGMLAPNAKISDEEVMRIIVEPGFSTRDAVTEISGRGVGMDVVNTAIKEIGGTLQIESIVDKGSKITLRFPFTISLNRILLFTVQNETYGILLANIEKIASIPVENINQKTFKTKGKLYNQIYLGEILNKTTDTFMNITNKKTYPLLLFSDAHYPLAFLVDSILYNRELVVQGLGGQFKMTDILSGATILGNGNVVYILDPYALTVKAKTCLEQKGFVMHKLKNNSEFVSNDQKKPLVLIVDDSVSSRTVTQRHMEKHNFQVITAKDGLDALQQLENYHPDLILLDIDMPRMDGFEFALILTKNHELKHIPIIIITSRIIEHKKRAMELNLPYLVEKPYQEQELLDIIHKILGIKL